LNRLVWVAMNRARKLVLIVAFIALTLPVCLSDAALLSQQSARSALEANPGTVVPCPSHLGIEAALSKASALLENEQYSSAAASLETFAKTKCDPRINLLLAGALEASGKASSAEEVLVRAHTSWPANTSIAASLARTYMNRDQVGKALMALNYFHVSPQTPLQEMQEAAVVYIASNRLVSAQGVAISAYKSYPALPTLLLLANVLQLEGRFKDVNRLLGEQRVSYENSSAYLITFAESEYDAMLYDAARADLEHAIKLDSKSYQAHYTLGNVLVALNQIDRAESEYRAAIELEPHQPRTYYQLALMFRDKGDDVNEESMLKQALAADDHYAPAYCESGRILMSQHRLADAVTELNLAIENNPKLEQAYYLLARAYAESGRKDDANAIVKRYTALRNSNRPTTVDKVPGQLGISNDAPQ
jgi:tetratricopeptide (TPR) repeat protein